MWHAACYTYHEDTKFPMPGIVDEEGNPWHNEDARRRQMMEGVKGSHLCIPFQCEMCWYWNLEGRNPTPGKDDVYLISVSMACWMAVWTSAINSSASMLMCNKSVSST
jgi:hypothetical protein